MRRFVGWTIAVYSIGAAIGWHARGRAISVIAANARRVHTQ